MPLEHCYALILPRLRLTSTVAVGDDTSPLIAAEAVIMTQPDLNMAAATRRTNPFVTFFAGAGGKVTAIGVVILILLIPLGMTGGLIAERQALYHGAVREIGAQWGLPQQFQGPFLQVPYRVDRALGNGEVKAMVETAYLLPETLNVDADLSPEVRSRGPYDAVVYTADVSARAVFAPPTPGEWDVEAADPLWDRAKVIFLISDPRGLVSTRTGFCAACRERPVGTGAGSCRVNAVLRCGTGPAVCGGDPIPSTWQ
jgi:hypothetical protein